MSITGRIRAFQVVLTVSVLALAAIALFGAGGANYYVDRVQLSRQQVDATTELAVRANRFSEQIAELLLIGEPERPDFEEARRQTAAAFEELRQLSVAEIEFVAGAEKEKQREELRHIDEMQMLFREIDRAVERVLLLDQQGRHDDALALFRSEIENRLDADFETLIGAAIANERREVAAADASAKELTRRLMIGALILIGLLLVVAVVSGLHFARSLRMPITAMTEGTLAIEHGDLDHRIAYAKRDEFGILANRFNAMADRLKRQRDELLAARENLEREVAERTGEIAEANRQLTELDQHRVRFLGDVSHELRTPLTVLRAEAEVALRGSAKPEAIYREALATIVTQSAEMSELVEDLLFLARSEADQIRFEFRPVRIADVVTEAVQDASVLARERDMRISVDCAEPGPLVRADPRRLKQALLVTLDNAAKYADAGSAIAVEVRAAEAGRAEIRVRDRGAGIPPDEVPHVFERFYRGSKALERGGGNGLGLPIARWIVEKHGGKLDLSSTPGVGTEIHLSLPSLA